jgi:hypothetical protein
LKKFFCVLLVLSLLSVPVFAVDDLIVVDGVDGSDFSTFGNTSISDYGISVLSGDQYAVTVSGFFYSYVDGARASFAMSDSNPSAVARTGEACKGVRFTNITASFPAGTLTIDFSEFSSVPSFSTSTAGASVSVSGSSLIITSDGSAQPILLTSSSSYTPAVAPATAFLLSSSFVASSGGGGSGGGGEEYTPGYSDMNGFHGVRQALSTATEWSTYNQYIGVQDVVMELTNKGVSGSAITGKSTSEFITADVMAGIGFNGWSWKIEDGTIKFSSGAPGGSWLDMIFRYLTYDYFWTDRLWSNSVSGSWYGAISDNFAYLNFRVNQILDVLANDEDLAIKDATTSEREWVKGYFTGSGDKADSSKYNSLDSDGQALKDFLTPSESASMSDALSAVESQGYSFWSENVYQDINQVSSTATVGFGDNVPWDEQINDLYSEHVALIGGAFDG